MPLPLGQLRRISQAARAAPSDALGERLARFVKDRYADEVGHETGSQMFGYNNRLYDRILDKEGVLRQPYSDEDFDALVAWSEGADRFDPLTLERLIDRYSIPAPNALLRGDTGFDLVDYNKTKRPLSTTVNPAVAEEFAELGGGSPRPGSTASDDYDQVVNRLESYALQKPELRARVLPMPISGQSEFVLAPNSLLKLIEDLPSDEDEMGFVRRLYRLSRKFGGQVKAQ